MMRRFHIQLVPRGVVRQSTEEMEAEARLLDGIALIIDIMIGRVNLAAAGDPWERRKASVIHDEANFHCFFGYYAQTARIVVKRGASALLWSQGERMAFATLVAKAYHAKNGGILNDPEWVTAQINRRQRHPLFDDDGNRLRPVEDPSSTVGDNQDGTRTHS